MLRRRLRRQDPRQLDRLWPQERDNRDLEHSDVEEGDGAAGATRICAGQSNCVADKGSFEFTNKNICFKN